MTDPVQLVTAPGRIVAGDFFKPNTRDAEGRPLVYKTGDKKGQPRNEWYIGLALPKADAEGWNTIWGKIHEVARAGFPHLFGADGNPTGKFAWKITDGDSTEPNTKGVRPCDREGYPGHWILNLSNGFAPKVYMQLPGQSLRELAEAEPGVHRGVFARVAFDVRANDSTQQPGVFLNHTMVQIVGFGEEIRFGADPTQVFGADAPAALPTGASATTVVKSPAPAPGDNAGTAQPPVPGASAAPTGGPAAPVQTTGQSQVTPVPSFANGPGQPPAPAPDAPAPEVTRITPDGRKFTEAQLRAAGWNDDQIAKLPTDTA